ncbi:MAG: hypothetical protein CMI52_01840 [Parcubacteria group bacterium]|nr:hypothetical protein [Parcubacteria group bacterium]
MGKLFNQKNQKEFRKTLRKNMPPAELALWKKLKNKQFLGLKFRRQHGVGPFVLDFYCPQLTCAIELDGESHFEKGEQERDAARDAFLKRHKITVIRILNTDVLQNIEGTLTYLKNNLP